MTTLRNTQIRTGINVLFFKSRISIWMEEKQVTVQNVTALILENILHSKLAGW